MDRVEISSEWNPKDRRDDRGVKKKEKRKKNGLAANRGSVLPSRAEKYEAARRNAGKM